MQKIWSIGKMIKYYRVSELKYQYDEIWVDLGEYYLLKEGWITCYDYREDPNDFYYLEYGGGGTRKNYCIERKAFKEEEMFESLEEAKKYLKLKLDEFYKEESLRLLEAYQRMCDKYQLGK
jgi:hypothetical protein